MKGRVGLVADGLPTLVVTHQLQVERRTGKVHQSETDVLPLLRLVVLMLLKLEHYDRRTCNKLFAFGRPS